MRDKIQEAVDMFISDFQSDEELLKIATKEDMQNIRLLVWSAVDFFFFVEKKDFSEEARQYTAATIRSRMDGFFDFKWFCNAVVPETKGVEHPLPKDRDELAWRYVEKFKSFQTEVDGEKKFVMLKELTALQLAFMAQVY